MREILFRGKRTGNEKWICGHLLEQNIPDCHSYIVMSIIAEMDNRHIEIMDFDINEVIPETVGQYTSLTDKNGVKIFEGDIVTGYFNYEKIVGYIFYGGNAQFFIQRDGIYGIALDNSDCWLEVIGNIHDDPELLKGGDGNG